MSDSISCKNGVLTENFEVPKTNQVYPAYNEFYVPDGYKFLKVRSWYPSFYFSAGVPGFEGIINMSIPAGDRDLQIYCNYEGQWMMAGLTNGWNAQGGMDIDKTSVYAYNDGKWSVSITDVPTKSLDSSFMPTEDIKATGLEIQKHHNLFGIIEFGRYGSLIDIDLRYNQIIQGHSGGWYGIHCELMDFMEDNYTIVILSNIDDGGKTGASKVADFFKELIFSFIKK